MKQNNVSMNQNLTEHKQFPIKSPKPDLKNFAGKYFFGDGLGFNFSFELTASGEFQFYWHGCLGTYLDVKGKTKYEDGKILLLPENNKQIDETGKRMIPRKLIPVKWGERSYLIEDKKIIDFCTAVNNGREPRSHGHGSFFLKDKDESKTVTGLPELPAQFHGYLLDKPITGKVIFIVDKYNKRSKDMPDLKFRYTTVKVDKGKQDGVLPGMKLEIIERDAFGDDIEIMEVDEHESKGKIVQILDKYSKSPKIGWRFTTGKY
jgi:hypothetical protein